VQHSPETQAPLQQISPVSQPMPVPSQHVPGVHVPSQQTSPLSQSSLERQGQMSVVRQRPSQQMLWEMHPVPSSSWTHW
jgi:hypothetical protein